MYCKLKYVVIYLKLLTNFVILRSFENLIYWYFKDVGFKYGPYLMQKAMDFNDIAIVYIKVSAYRIHFSYMSKDDAINIMNGSNLVDKRGIL